MKEHTLHYLKEYLQENKYSLKSKAKSTQYKIRDIEYIQILMILFDDERFKTEDIGIDSLADDIVEDYEMVICMTVEFDFTKVNVKRSKSGCVLKIDR